MKYAHKSPAVLLLQDGTVFYGKSAGKIGTATGEICFNTGMTGYQEIFTDPSYKSQIMVMTSVHIGNYGVCQAESESSSAKISALVCRNFSDHFSRKKADQSLQDYFIENNMVVVSDVDTRAIVQHIRSKGAMNAIVSSEETDLVKLKAMLAKVPSMEGLELSSTVTTNKAYTYGDPAAALHVAVIDLGVKENTLRCLADRGCYVKVFPMNTSFEEMEKFNPQGYLVSNGPGDPAVMPAMVDTVKKILNSDKALMGICLGHQMLAEACGIKTFKMFNGHRGINHPVKNMVTGRAEVTSQNHGFGVIPEETINKAEIEITHVNLNDQSIEGISVKNKKAFSVQYHPEAAPGPNDARYLFDNFVSSVREVKEQAVTV
ncbi:MAG TPA: glutamine-hydrolyzing carbamoyl-phosphate synthase small subunit [Bacteroidia bacterium]|nr:glutamine-hydrolyzing carbamoyl-phosphate synthase small subunit [Bacteroidia bacterium]HMW11463.1 glutamine-hydrolyzing carbamoyl-phosphate synthase small subunit [Bacteroidia bacterium]HNG85290.1 glutamine-hydrolyzing carbamoyl-phosphate synthase small subunit [Bacteroidia bacterium]HOM90719.1 glutamine-hydrolyzing carbamoyl-phosphate synthase small subunit [Bacteroidia bacterium]